MATNKGVGGIEPASSPGGKNVDEYYDMMVVGMSGMGKSTTADKILIASKLSGLQECEGMDDGEPTAGEVTTKPAEIQDSQLDGGSNMKVVAVDVTEESDDKAVQQISGGSVSKLQSNGEGSAKLTEKRGGDENEPVVKEKKLTMHNLTFWTACSLPEELKDPVTTYLKNLHFYRELEDSHLEINKCRSKQEVNPITSSCQLVSNDDTRMRVLDVPGFFGVKPLKRERQPMFSFEQDFRNCTSAHLSLMRDVLRIQSTMTMTFRRILYFLPGRGPLGRQTEVLRQDLFLLAQYFGPTVFECMVLIATVQPRLSIAAIAGGAFSAEELEDTRLVFKEMLEDILASYPTYRVPLSPPVLYISLLDTGECIVEKIKAAEVHADYLKLTFDPGVCAKCSCTVLWLENEKVECVPVGRDESDESVVIPYGDSLCHPIFLPKNRRPHKIDVEDGVTYIALSVPKGEGRRNEPSEEVCHNCQRPPGTEGCLKVGKKYPINMDNGECVKIVVDHSNQIEEHRGLHQSMEVKPEDQDEGARQGEDGGASQQKRQPGDGQREGGLGRGKIEGRASGQQIPGSLLVEQEVAHSPRVKTAVDDGESSSAMVVPKPRSEKRPYDSDYCQPCDSSLQDAFGDLMRKGT